ncbi:MAG TPA: hypothetical protein VMP03_08035 [Methylomirabilota bacterium]|nr:hypothetical protein [Methylomirabilota bacterium]
MVRDHRNPPTTHTSGGAGVFRRTYEAMLGARQQRARSYVTYFLLALDDAALHELGYDRASLERDRSGRSPL